jgi:hypothetical protein
MTWRDVYIGFLDDTFDWDHPGGNGNCPKRRSPFFPSSAPFDRLIQKIESGEYDGKQLDWGGWGAKVNKQQIREFIAESYKDSVELIDGSLVPKDDYLEDLLRYLNELDDSTIYILVAAEL